ncbi:unnamed protein product [Linum trigynum]|uniref:Uncharacterized protein n=1 Tax=Linum trigynum TaxID=586398 RepID=A0AAV2ER55_9ROSI
MSPPFPQAYTGQRNPLKIPTKTPCLPRSPLPPNPICYLISIFQQPVGRRKKDEAHYSPCRSAVEKSKMHPAPPPRRNPTFYTTAVTAARTQPRLRTATRTNEEIHRSPLDSSVAG